MVYSFRKGTPAPVRARLLRRAIGSKAVQEYREEVRGAWIKAVREEMEGKDKSGDIKELESVEADNCLGWEEDREGWYDRKKSKGLPGFCLEWLNGRRGTSGTKEWRKNQRFGGKMLSLVLNLSLRVAIQEKSRLKIQSSDH